MLLTTVEIKLHSRTLKLYLHEGDNLYKRIQDFTKLNKVDDLCEDIFEDLYSQLNKPIERRKWDQKQAQFHHYSDLRSTKRQLFCQKFVSEESTHSPNINKSITVSPFAQRLNTKQIVQKDHNLRHSPIQKPIESFTFTPKINKTSRMTTTPFRERLNKKQLLHKEHCLRHQSPNIIQKQKIKRYYTGRKESDSEDEIIAYSNNQFIHVKQEQNEPKQIEVVTDGTQLHQLVKRIYNDIKDKYTTLNKLQLLIDLYRNMLCTQEYRNLLKLNKINYQLLDVDQIALLEQLQLKYKIGFHLEITQNQFLILMLSLTNLNGNAKISSLIDYKLSSNYQKLIK